MRNKQLQGHNRLLHAHRDQAQVDRSEQAEQNGTPRADAEKSPLVVSPPEESVDQLERDRIPRRWQDAHKQAFYPLCGQFL